MPFVTSGKRKEWTVIRETQALPCGRDKKSTSKGIYSLATLRILPPSLYDSSGVPRPPGDCWFGGGIGMVFWLADIGRAFSGRPVPCPV